MTSRKLAWPTGPDRVTNIIIIIINNKRRKSRVADGVPTALRGGPIRPALENPQLSRSVPNSMPFEIQTDQDPNSRQQVLLGSVGAQ